MIDALPKALDLMNRKLRLKIERGQSALQRVHSIEEYKAWDSISAYAGVLIEKQNDDRPIPPHADHDCGAGQAHSV